MASMSFWFTSQIDRSSCRVANGGLGLRVEFQKVVGSDKQIDVSVCAEAFRI